jgi:glycosyltransferase involved in cell wall biosynthesis
MSPRVAFLTPFAFPSVRGNAVTVARIARGLSERGIVVGVWDLSVSPEQAIETEVAASRPALVHAFHAYRAGPLALRLARRMELPLVLTLTGTDVNHDLFDRDRAGTVRRVLEGAASVVVFHDSVRARIAAALPDVEGRVVVIAQAARLDGAEPFDLAARWTLPAARTLFLFPGGVRPVKGPRVPLTPLTRLVARRPDVRLLYAGPILDAREGEALLADLASRPWARHVGAVPHAQMRSLLGQGDVVLNCSRSEGGMANSVLEALAMERAVLAADIEGNRSLIEDGVTGLLFRDAAEFEAAAERLARDPALRARLGRAGRERVDALYPPSREIDAHVDLYRALTGFEAGFIMNSLPRCLESSKGDGA